MLSEVSIQLPCDVTPGCRGSMWLVRVLFLLCLHCLTQTCAYNGNIHAVIESRDATPPQAGRALSPDLVNTPCFKHKTCYECLQDPCSRAMRLNNSTNRHALTAICVWCTTLKETLPIRQACLPASLAGVGSNYCIPDNLLWDGDGDVCNSSSEPREGNCVALGDKFALNLGGSPSPSPVQLPEYPGVWISFSLCNSVPPSTSVAEVCGSRTPLEAVQTQDSLMLTQKRSLDGSCWYGGIRAAVSVALHSMSNPCDGVTVSYGPSNCCPAGHVEPGVFSEFDVTVKVSPAWEHCDKPDYVVVNTTNIATLCNFLYSCSSSHGATLEYHVLSSQLCPQYIDWELDPTATSFHCEMSDVGEGDYVVVKCFVLPVCFRGRLVCSQHVCSYPHIVLEFTNTTGESWNTTLNAMTDRFNGTCSFVYRADGLSRIEALYQYYHGTAVRLAGKNPFVLSWGSDSDLLTRSVYSVIYAPVGFTVVIVVFICLWHKKRKRRQPSGYRPLADHGGSEIQPPQSNVFPTMKQPEAATNPVEILGETAAKKDVKLGATASAGDGCLPDEASTKFQDGSGACSRDKQLDRTVSTVNEFGRQRTPVLVRATGAGDSSAAVDGRKKRSVCFIAYNRDNEWVSEELEAPLKNLPNLDIRVTDGERCARTKLDVMTEAVESSDYVIIVVSRGVCTNEKEIELYKFMVEKAEQRKVHAGINFAKPFLVSRDGCMEGIPKNLNQDCCADFSTSNGWNMLRMTIEEHEEMM